MGRQQKFEIGKKNEVLRDVFGHSEFRGEQEAVVDAVLAGQNALALMPTGMGKSLCYQLPARMMSGLTLVVSPLIALMKDQVDAAQKKGLRCCFINSSLDRREREDRYRRLAEGEYELVYVTPERFRKTEFCEAVTANKVDLLAVDEAHCVSQWGHDFRPDYTRIDEFRALLGGPPTLALTATATPEVQNDIIVQMGLEVGEVEVFDGGMQRPNLVLSFQDLYGLEQKVQYFVMHRHKNPGPMIVYFSLIDTLEKFSRQLDQLGFSHRTYHGRMSNQQRRSAQEWFVKTGDGIILATPAFGLGVDKENVRSVLHAEIPGSIESYYQEVGRAGRDGEPADCVLLFDGDDVAIQMDFIKWANPEPSFIIGVHRLVEKNPDRLDAEGLDFLRGQMNFYNSRDFRLETALNLLERWGCLEVTHSGSGMKYRVNGEIPKEYLNDEIHGSRVKNQQKKLFDIVQLVKDESDPKPRIYEYFGLKNENAEE